MRNSEKRDISLGALILPGAVFEHFDVVDVFSNDKQIDLFLDEKYAPPGATDYTSKGFTEQSVIQDFPLIGKAVYLHIRRRKWQNSLTGEIVTNKYDLTHLGTQITTDFASFLKGIHRKLRH